ncbi:MAG: DUF357 domain-containing protein [Candidatus Aenigmatarchaeota archaeon]|nr:DUF357 domain-containing protein [Candidatus Aenigmarchaeota archaeon]
MRDHIAQQDVERWLAKLEPLISRIEVQDSKGEAFLTNIKAYVADSRYFLSKGDLVRAFEAMIWAWSLWETCAELGLLALRA